MSFRMAVKFANEEKSAASGRPDPKDVVRAIKSAVATRVMEAWEIPGAFSIPIKQEHNGVKIEGSLELKLIPSGNDGHFMYNINKCALTVGGVELTVGGNAAFPKDPQFYLSQDNLKVYSLCKKAITQGSKLSDKEKAELDAVLTQLAKDASTNEAGMSAGESTGKVRAA